METWKDFDENPILTTYQVKSPTNGLRFPTVLICPFTTIHYQQARERCVDMDYFKENKCVVGHERALINDLRYALQLIDAEHILSGDLSAVSRLNEILTGQV